MDQELGIESAWLRLCKIWLPCIQEYSNSCALYEASGWKKGPLLYNNVRLNMVN